MDGVEEGLSYTLQVRSDKSGIIVNDNSDRTSEVHVDAGDTGFCNQIVREYTFSGHAVENNITTSSYVVVHRVKEPLIYNDECLCLKENERAAAN